MLHAVYVYDLCGDKWYICPPDLPFRVYYVPLWFNGMSYLPILDEITSLHMEPHIELPGENNDDEIEFSGRYDYRESDDSIIQDAIPFCPDLMAEE